VSCLRAVQLDSADWFTENTTRHHYNSYKSSRGLLWSRQADVITWSRHKFFIYCGCCIHCGRTTNQSSIYLSDQNVPGLLGSLQRIELLGISMPGNHCRCSMMQRHNLHQNDLVLSYLSCSYEDTCLYLPLSPPE